MKIKFFIFALFITGLPVLLAGCDNEVKTTTITPANTAAANAETAENGATAPTTDARPEVTESIEPGDIAANPEKYIGKEVTVVGEVEEVFSPLSFTLDEEAAAGREDVLVLSPKKPDLNLEEVDDNWLNDGVIVKGMVKRLVTAEIEKELTWDLDTKIEAEYRDRPVIIASSIVKR